MSRPIPKPTVADPRFNRLNRLRRISRLLDNAVGIPGTKYRVGLDPIIGLIPGGGDVVGLVLSSYIVIEAARLGASKATLGRMAFNVLVETVVGAVPIVGDIFDATWKSNARNVELLEAHLDLPQASQKANRWFLVLLIVGLGLATIGLVTLMVILLRWLFQAVS